jgi:type II secretory pathway component GspD/PulD (secretin)
MPPAISSVVYGLYRAPQQSRSGACAAGVYYDITSMIEALDRPGMQVMIKAVIMEIGLSDMTSLGIQLSSNGSFASTLGPNALTALNTLIYRGPEVTSSGTTTSTTHFSSVTDANLDVLVDLLVKNAMACAESADSVDKRQREAFL